SSRRRHTRFSRDWSSDVCSSDLDAPGRQVDDALETNRILGLENKAQIGYHVLDFFAVVEPNSADNLVRHTETDKHFFNCPGLGEIGRASCRERVQMSGLAGYVSR